MEHNLLAISPCGFRQFFLVAPSKLASFVALLKARGKRAVFLL